MRIWSIHPKYLDAKGLVALWREALLAKKVLEGKTKGYRNHPQLNRFKQEKNPVNSINCYLVSVYEESVKRGYQFNKEKIGWNFKSETLTVTNGQVIYERNHLLNKLKTRDKKKYDELIEEQNFSPHPMFKIVQGDVEDWEIIEKEKIVTK